MPRPRPRPGLAVHAAGGLLGGGEDDLGRGRVVGHVQRELLEGAAVTGVAQLHLDLPGERDADPPKAVTGLQASSFAVNPSDRLLPAQTYAWHVRALDGMGNVGAWSDTWEFTTGL